MAIKFSQFNLRTDSTPTMFLVGYDGNQNIHITVDNLLNNVINGTENTIAMFGPGGTSVIDSAITQQTIIGGDKLVTVQGFLNIDEDVSVDRDLTVTRNSILNGNVQLGNGSADLITQYGTLYLNGPVKDKDNNFGGADQVLVSNISSELRFTDLTGIAVGSAEVVEVPVKNLQGSPLTKGDPVYISGDVGASGRLEVKLADASNAAKMPALGLLKQDLGINEEGLAVITGKLRNLPTDPIDGQTPLANDVIYVKAGGTTGAALTLTKPTGSNLIQNMGKVGRVSTSNDGTFVVSSILRTNDIPNLTPGKIWVGSTGNTIESQTLFVDEANGRLGINETNPGYSLDVDGTLQTSGWAYFATTGPTSIAQLGGASTTTSQFNISTTATGGSFIAATNALTFKTNNVDAIKIDNAAAVQFNLYGNGVYTGTAARNLSVDSSGNIIETNVAIDGSGTLNYVAKFTPDGNTLGNSVIYDNGTNVGIGTTNPGNLLELQTQAGSGVTGDEGIFVKSPFAGATPVVGYKNPFISIGTTSDPYTTATATLYLGEAATATGQQSKIEYNATSNKLEIYGFGTTLLKHVEFGNAGSVTPRTVFYGDVGIGTTNPQAKLDVNGNFRINTNNLTLSNTPSWGVPTQNIIGADDNTNGATLTLMNTSATIPAGGASGTLQFVALDDASNSGGSGYATASISAISQLAPGTGQSGQGTLIFKTGGYYSNISEKMRITYDGNVGIGATNPTGKLEVRQAANNGDTGAFTNTHVKLTASATADSTGFVGITAATSTSDNYGYSFGAQRTSGGVGSFKINYHNNSAAGTNRFIIDQNGNVGIGATSPAAKLDVNGGVRIANDAAAASATNVGTLRYRTSGNNSYVDMVMQTGASTYAWVNIVENNW